MDMLHKGGVQLFNDYKETNREVLSLHELGYKLCVVLVSS